MDEDQIANIWPELISRGILPSAEIKDILNDFENTRLLLETLEKENFKGILDKKSLESIIGNIKKEESKNVPEYGRTIAPISEPEIKSPERPHGLPHYSNDDFSGDASDLGMGYEIIYDITGNSVTEGKKGDISAFFDSRLEKLKKMIVRSGLPNRHIDIGELVNRKFSFTGYDTSATVIGIVNKYDWTKNGHFFFTIEDKTGEIDCMIYKETDPDFELQQKESQRVLRRGFMTDDIVGITGNFTEGKDTFIVQDIHFPPLSNHKKNHSEDSVSVAFISDIHLGSKTFLDAQWHKMIKWFHESDVAKSIKYLVLSGDVVDGIGIYPGQEKELAIPDVYKQYSEFAKLLEMLPEWVECLLLPGNHDAVRPAEPQPAIDPEIQQDYNSTIFVGNPCKFKLHGVSLLSYHGKSLDDFVGMRELDYSIPQEAMKQMLQRRHLAPSWGKKTPLSPEPEDNMVIDEIPDIFVTGHVHGHYSGNYRGTTLICSSTWQDQTSYQRMLGFQPKPCILTVVNLKTHETASIPFA